MAQTQTLKQHAAAQRTAAATVATGAARQLSDAHIALGAALAAVQAASASFTSLDAKDADLRRRLAAAADAMPADATALAEAIELNTVAVRAQAAKAGAAGQALANARQAFVASGAQAHDAAARLAAAEQAKVAADERQATIDAAAVALGKPPLKAVPTAAGDVLNGAVKAAETRIKADLPLELRTRAGARYDLNAAELTRAQAAALEAAAATDTASGIADGPRGQSAGALVTMRAAEHAYLAGLDNDSDLRRATEALAQVLGAPPISAERRSRMTSGPIVDAGAAAAALEATRDSARAEIAKRKPYEERQVAALANAHDPAEDADVATARTALDIAIAALKDAEDQLDAPAAGQPTPREVFGRWEATVPAQEWDAIITVERARATLERLAAFKPDALLDALKLAEDAYITALAAEVRSALVASALAALAAERSSAADVAVRTNSDLSAVRGDL